MIQWLFRYIFRGIGIVLFVVGIISDSDASWAILSHIGRLTPTRRTDMYGAIAD